VHACVCVCVCVCVCMYFSLNVFKTYHNYSMWYSWPTASNAHDEMINSLSAKHKQYIYFAVISNSSKNNLSFTSTVSYPNANEKHTECHKNLSCKEYLQLVLLLALQIQKMTQYGKTCIRSMTNRLKSYCWKNSVTILEKNIYKYRQNLKVSSDASIY
jgi:hypothetical protein